MTAGAGLATLCVFAAPSAASAAAITVNQTADVRGADGSCSLREAIDSANNDSAPFAGAGECASGSGADVISLPADTLELTIAGDSFQLDDNANLSGDFDILGTELTIAGAGSGATTIDGNAVDRVFDVQPNRTVVIRGVTVTGGQGRAGGGGVPVNNGGSGNSNPANGGDGFPGGPGGGIRSAGSLTVEDSVVTDNTAGTGGNGGFATAGFGSTGSFATAGGQATGGDGGVGGHGGGIFTSGVLTVRRSTVSGNTAGMGGFAGSGTGGQGGTATTGFGGGGGTGSGGWGGSGGDGGGIAAATSTVVTVEDSTISGNAGGAARQGAFGQGGLGGTTTGSNTNGGTGGGSVGGRGGEGGGGAGISALGALTVRGSTIVGNTAGVGGNGANGTGGNGGAVSSAQPGTGGAGGSGVGGSGGNGGNGGGLEVDPQPGSLTLVNSTITGNVSGNGAAGATGTGGAGGPPNATRGAGGGGFGGHGGNAGVGAGLADWGTATVRHDTFSSNSFGVPGAAGAGVAGSPSGGSPPAAQNGSPGQAGSGGGVWALVTTPIEVATLANSVLAGNAGPSCGGSGLGGGGNNIAFPDATCPATVADPLLAPLADNGGPTMTQALGAGSPAIDAVPASGANCDAADQRGVPRPFGAACDSGAYERAGPSVVTGDATGVSLDAATLQGALAPNAPSAEYRFEFGTTTAYGSSTPPQTAQGLGSRPVSAGVGGLAQGTTYHYRLVGTNADGTSFGADRTFTTTGVAGGDTEAPRFLSASLSPNVFAVNRRGTPEVSVAAKKGTTFRYSLSEAARVTFTIQRRTRGRRVRGKCRKQTRANRTRPPCRRWVRKGRFAVASVAGANKHKFSGRIGKRSLGRGRYRAVMVARDAAGNASAAKRLRFRVVRR